MHKEVLTPEQIRLLPLVALFSKDFGLVGGTAIALYIGHRRSIDFGLFTPLDFHTLKLRKRILATEKIDEVLRDEQGQYTIIVRGVHMTFFSYPFPISYAERFAGRRHRLFREG